MCRSEEPCFSSPRRTGNRGKCRARDPRKYFYSSPVASCKELGPGRGVKLPPELRELCKALRSCPLHNSGEKKARRHTGS
jgi:hypothetical protein